jgi:hypothetical protein
MDLKVPLGGDPGLGALMVDITRRFQGTQDSLRRAEQQKEEKYENFFLVPATMKGAAFNELGELGPGACDVVGRLVALGARATGSHPDDLRVELLGRVGVAIFTGNARAYAHFADLNQPEARGFAPFTSALAPSGQRAATGMTGRLTRWKGRGRPKGATAAVTAARRVAAGRAAAARVASADACVRQVVGSASEGGAGLCVVTDMLIDGAGAQPPTAA